MDTFTARQVHIYRCSAFGDNVTPTNESNHFLIEHNSCAEEVVSGNEAKNGNSTMANTAAPMERGCQSVTRQWRS